MLTLFRITGNSMAPDLSDGALVLAVRLPRRWLRSGQRVVLETQDGAVIVKRIEHVAGRHSLVLTSDNPLTRSRYCDLPLRPRRVFGVVIELPGWWARPARDAAYRG
ncbi:MAG: S24/S26 family peptidase [Pseudomonadota bacterium]